MSQNASHFVLLAAIALSVTGLHVSANPNSLRYMNQNYGYAVSVPAYLAIATDPPPAPQHGFQIILGQGRDISVDARYDSTFLGSAESAFEDRAADDGSSTQLKPSMHQMAGLNAERIQDVVSAQWIDLAVAYRPNGNDVAIIYTFELDTDADNQARDEPVFNEVLRGFGLLPFPK